MRRITWLGLATAAGVAWGARAWSAACPQDCDEADKVNGCCPQEATSTQPAPSTPAQPPSRPRTTTPKPPAAPAEPAPAAALEVRELGGVRMVRVPAGTFLMGSADGDEEAYDNEKPQHTVTISQDFWLMETEVTQALWASVMGTAPWDQADRRAYEGVSVVSPRYPAIYVSWCDAILFANALSARDGLTKVYSYPANFVKGMDKDTCNALANEVKWDKAANGYRLPTEAEWEYAAREGERSTRYAGTSDPDRVCHYGNVRDAAASLDRDVLTDTFLEESFSCTDKHVSLAPVGSFASSGWGLKDMTGNVNEWVYDGEEQFSNAASLDPVIYFGTSRVIRGSSWLSDRHTSRATCRVGWEPGYQGLMAVGLRLARSAPSQ